VSGAVLLVEDEPVARRLAERILTLLGWQVVSAASAEAALELAGSGRFVALVTDMELPGISGAALVAALRGQPGGAALPAIIVSGHAQAALRRDATVQALLAAEPVTLLLSKPYGLPELRARMAAITGGTG
jgi:CheY-like chemotaxis protein